MDDARVSELLNRLVDFWGKLGNAKTDLESCVEEERAFIGRCEELDKEIRATEQRLIDLKRQRDNAKNNANTQQRKKSKLQCDIEKKQAFCSAISNISKIIDANTAAVDYPAAGVGPAPAASSLTATTSCNPSNPSPETSTSVATATLAETSTGASVAPACAETSAGPARAETSAGASAASARAETSAGASAAPAWVKEMQRTNAEASAAPAWVKEMQRTNAEASVAAPTSETLHDANSDSETSVDATTITRERQPNCGVLLTDTDRQVLYAIAVIEGRDASKNTKAVMDVYKVSATSVATIAEIMLEQHMLGERCIVTPCRRLASHRISSTVREYCDEHKPHNARYAGNVFDEFRNMKLLSQHVHAIPVDKLKAMADIYRDVIESTEHLEVVMIHSIVKAAMTNPRTKVEERFGSADSFRKLWYTLPSEQSGADLEMKTVHNNLNHYFVRKSCSKNTSNTPPKVVSDERNRFEEDLGDGMWTYYTNSKPKVFVIPRWFDQGLLRNLGDTEDRVSRLMKELSKL